MSKFVRLAGILLGLSVLLYSCVFINNRHTIQSPSIQVSALPENNFNTPLPAVTLKPVLSILEAENEVINLLQNNGECRLPCFWGIIPGQSSKQITHSNLHSYLSIIPEDFLFGEKGGGVGVIIPDNDFILSTHLIIRNYDDLPRQDIVRWLQIDLAIYDKDSYTNFYDSLIYDKYYKYYKYYTLSSLLSNYGKPTNVYINFENDMGLREYYLFLDYTDSGWVAMLKMPLSQEENFFVGCPALAFTRLWLWSVEDIETAKEYGFIENVNLKSINEVTSLSLSEFYDKFKNPSNAECLRSPIDIYSQ